MIKKTITYTDYNGLERTEDFYFNLTKAELTEMQISYPEGMSEMVKRLIAANDQKTVVEIFKDLILRSYGEKSLDGRKFVKNQELRDSFAQTEAYSELFMELATNTDAGTAFVNGIVSSITAKAAH